MLAARGCMARVRSRHTTVSHVTAGKMNRLTETSSSVGRCQHSCLGGVGSLTVFYGGTKLPHAAMIPAVQQCADVHVPPRGMRLPVCPGPDPAGESTYGVCLHSERYACASSCDSVYGHTLCTNRLFHTSPHSQQVVAKHAVKHCLISGCWHLRYLAAWCPL